MLFFLLFLLVLNPWHDDFKDVLPDFKTSRGQGGVVQVTLIVQFEFATGLYLDFLLDGAALLAVRLSWGLASDAKGQGLLFAFVLAIEFVVLHALLPLELIFSELFEAWYISVSFVLVALNNFSPVLRIRCLGLLFFFLDLALL